MATIFSDNFNSYTNGALVGQGGWTNQLNGSYYTVQETTVKEGAKAVQVSDNTSINIEVYKTGTVVDTGRITVYMRRSDTAGRATFALKGDIGYSAYFRLDNDGYIKYYGNGAWNTWGAYLANTWYTLEIEWNGGTDQIRYRVDEGTWTAWLTPLNTWTTGLNRVEFWCYQGSGSSFWDYIAEYPLLPQKLVSDSGSGVDTVEIKRKVSITDSGSGVDIIGIKSKVPITDSGVGTDTISAISAKVPITDSGNGVDIIKKVNQILAQDLGLGTETITAKLTKLVQDFGVGQDVISSIKAFLSISDLGSGIDTIRILSKILIQDSGVGADLAQMKRIVNISESGIGNDTLLVLAKLLLTDSGAGTDVIRTLRAVNLIDSGVGIDTASNILLQVLIQELGLGVDQVRVPPIYTDKYSKQGDIYYDKFL